MKILYGSLICIMLMLTLVVPVFAAPRRMQRTHNIHVEVLSLDDALAAIQSLNAMVLDSSRSTSPIGRGQTISEARLTLRVDPAAFRQAQDVVRALGDVFSEHELTTDFDNQITDADVRIAVLNTELERLTLMMAASNTLDVLIAVNDRVTQVMRQRDDIIGHKNWLMNQVQSPVMTISLFEAPAEWQEPERDGFGARIETAFLRSARSIQRGFANLFVGFVRISLPFFVFLVIGLLIAFIVVKIQKKYQVSPSRVYDLKTRMKAEKDQANTTDARMHPNTETGAAIMDASVKIEMSKNDTNEGGLA